MIDYLILGVIILFKIFLFPTSHSTDFEVHRNWKAITNSLPVSEWYFYSKNKWTLDYPPLFAYMEYILGKISTFIDEDITNLKKVNYDSTKCIIFMRSTVLLGDLFLFFSLKYFSKVINLNLNKYLLLIFSILFNSGLVIVDNIHFQYNGILFGLFFISLAYIAKKQYALGAIFYTICLCMKHLFIYFAPAYFLFYFHYIVINNIKKKRYKKLIINLILIGLGMVSVIIISFLPFIAISFKSKDISQLIQIKERLFPLNRGLLHTYWAPNFWALYSLADKVLYYSYTNLSHKFKFIETICNFFLKYKEFSYNYRRNTSSKGAGSQGVSKETGFDILPDINMKTTNIIIITFIVIYYMKYLYTKTNEKKGKIKLKTKKIKEFIQHCIFSNLIFFNFGYQVHEKAFLNISILALLYYIISVFTVVTEDKKILVYSDDLTSLTLIIVFIGTAAQMPLVNDPKDYLVKVGLVLFYYVYCNVMLFNKGDFNSDCGTKVVITITLILILILDFFITFQNSFDFDLKIPGMKELEKLCDRFPFIFLMSFSTLNSVFVQVIFLLLFT